MKALLLGNLGTKAMALLLAIITWAYLYLQGVGAEDNIVLEFVPETLDPEVYASVTYRTDKGETLVPGQKVHVRATGPKADVRNHALRLEKTFKVEVPLKAKDLSEPQGTHTVTLNRSHFTIPGDNISVEPLFGDQVRVHYVQFRRKSLELVASQFDTQGVVKTGFRVESITPSKPSILANVPADIFDQVSRVRIQPVPVEGKDDAFPPLGDWEIEEAALKRNIRPLEKFRVDVKIVPTPSRRSTTVDLRVNATPEVLKKVKLETPSIKIELQGPDDLLKEAPDSAFRPFVLVSDADVATPGPKLIKEAALGCHIDPKYAGRIRVVLMPDERPENREVKITVQ